MAASPITVRRFHSLALTSPPSLSADHIALFLMTSVERHDHLAGRGAAERAIDIVVVARTP
jgi:hypothetical protein